MPQRDVIVIGGSAGALQALTTILEGLPADLRASVLIVMHTHGHSNGILPRILSRAGPLPVAFAKHNEPLKHGRVYVAEPDCHLIVTPGGLRLVHGPRENGFRPAIDPLFRTAARQLGSRVIGVILSGALSDGTYGLSLVKQHGGAAIVQDPADAGVASMPRHALDAVDVDFVLPAAQIAVAITRLCADPSKVARNPGEDVMVREDDLEPQLQAENTEVAEMEDRFGAPAPLTCPDCGGTLWEIEEGRVVRYQCHVGHQYSPEALEDEQRDGVDSALWSAVRVLEEHAALKMRMAKRASGSGLGAVSNGFAEGARDAHAQAQRIRSILFTAETGRRGEPEAGRPTSRRRGPRKRVPHRPKSSREPKNARTNERE